MRRQFKKNRLAFWTIHEYYCYFIDINKFTITFFEKFSSIAKKNSKESHPISVWYAKPNVVFRCIVWSSKPNLFWIRMYLCSMSLLFHCLMIVCVLRIQQSNRNWLEIRIAMFSKLNCRYVNWKQLPELNISWGKGSFFP